MSAPDLIIQNGWLSTIRHCYSPNFNQRPNKQDISLLIIHNISLPPNQFQNNYIEKFFCNQLPVDEHPYFASISELKVSAHCLVARSGEITQFVSFEERAWHAGVSRFQGRENCNDFSIGIELEGADNTPYEVCQYQALVKLTSAIQKCYPAITLERIVGHSDVAPDRKTDPGDAFDWSRYLYELRTKI